MIGQVVGNYRLVSELGRGGMGLVFRAEHVQLGRPAALKMLLPQFSHDAGIVTRFFNEARAASAIDHPGIVEIYDFGHHSDGSAYIVMALLQGESLERRIARQPLSPVEAASFAAQAASALAAAHARGIIHRDLKPDNLFLVPNELVTGGIQLKLLDFGIAKLVEERDADFRTQTGAVIGTPAYMSPEQCMGSATIDHRTDLYALGCILFHMLCGRPPFTSTQGIGVLIAAHLRDPVPDPRTFAPNIPDALVGIVLRLLEKEPAARFQSAAELRAALQAAGAVGSTYPNARPLVEPYGATVATGISIPPGVAPPQTTSSGAAAQVIPLQHVRQISSRRTGWIVGGVALVAASIAAIAVLGARAAPDVPAAPVAAAQPPPAPPPPLPPAPVATPATCPAGQVVSDDTRGHCCWPGQAWSSANERCVGAPACPEGMVAKNEACVARVASTTPPATSGDAPPTPAAPPARTQGLPERPARVEPVPEKPETPPIAATWSAFSLDAKTYAPNGKIKIRFRAAIPSKHPDRKWVAVAPAGSAESMYLDWKYVDDGGTSSELTAPAQSGMFEVRLHDHYPTKSTHLVASQKFGVDVIAGDNDNITPRAQQKFSLDSTKLEPGGRVTLQFPTTLNPRNGERFWVAFAQPGSADSAYTQYEWVPARVTSMTMKVPVKPGPYEIRLHANYPTVGVNVVHKASVVVE
ncbi:MAG: serine/threonine-protein kinase [Kofleriaceae bacterium]|nr:serine/threonine-protein kinase [Kofleriaceae bacterium]